MNIYDYQMLIVILIPLIGILFGIIMRKHRPPYEIPERVAVVKAELHRELVRCRYAQVRLTEAKPISKDATQEEREDAFIEWMQENIAMLRAYYSAK